MTNEAATDIRQWLVSARSRGELLATSARAHGIELVMVGVPAGYSGEEVESWLRDLCGMALETSSAESGDRPIPPILHHLLTGLIFSHSELWDRGGAAAPTSMAFVRTAREVAFGWVNGPKPELWIDDHPAHVEWVKIRDQDGREAFALSIDPAHRVRVHFGMGDAQPAATVDAVWVPETSATESPASETGEADRTAASRAVGARAGGLAEPPSMPAAAIEAPRLPQGQEGENWTVVYEGQDSGPPVHGESSDKRPWWAGVSEWIAGRATKPAATDDWPERAVHALPEAIPPTPEPAELTERTAPAVVVETHAGMAEIQLAPLEPEEPVGVAANAVDPTSSAADPAACEIEVESVHLDEPPVRRRPPVAAAVPVAPPPIAATLAPAVPVARQGTPPAPVATSAFARAAAAAPPVSVAAPAAPLPLAVPESVEDGVLSAPPIRPRRVPRPLEWSESARSSGDRPVWARPWVWAIGVVVLFLGGWLLGELQNDHSNDQPSAFARTLRAVGLGGARFDLKVNSRPPGAWISVDGKDIARRTPATVDLKPGKHQVTLSFADLGAANFEVRGVRGDRPTLDANLAGSLTVYSGDGGIPVAVSVDGEARGLAPVTVENLAPGTHEVRFSGPGLQPWGQTVQVKVQETAQLAARVVTSPATGVLEVHALWTDAEGSDDLTGANVYIDGEKRGVTPFSAELPRGPHSVRVESRGEKSPVQVIDLPGGNQRFANFELGLGIERPTLDVLGLPVRVPLEQPAVISAALQGLHASEAREMWLNVRQPDGAWRRYPMMMMNAPGGVVGSSVFPNTLLDAQGRTPFYVSASSQAGDDYFSEVLTATEQPAAARK